MAGPMGSRCLGERIDFLPWLSEVMQVIASLEHGHQAAVDVPCGTCQLCCQRTRVPVTEEEAQDPDLKAVRDDTGWIIPKVGIDCIHLDNGCQIYDMRPATCRVFDCRKRIVANMADDRTQEMALKWDLSEWFTPENEIYINAIRLCASNFHAQFPEANISAIVSYAIVHWPEYLGIIHLASKENGRNGS